jgi:hypothetical protein
MVPELGMVEDVVQDVENMEALPPNRWFWLPLLAWGE